MLEDNQSLPSNGKLYSKLIRWLQRTLLENGEQLESLMEEVSTEPGGLFHHCCVCLWGAYRWISNEALLWSGIVFCLFILKF